MPKKDAFIPADGLTRCGWVRDELDLAYHDSEWGVPLHNDDKLFEMLILEGMQAGLSWNLILHRREGMRRAFDGFDPRVIQNYGEEKLAALMQDTAVIRNRLKLAGLVANAKAFLHVQGEFGSFDTYVWGFVKGTPIQNHFKNMAEIPASTPLSDAMSKDMKKRGFKFVGTTICYAFMQATGMVNDHVAGCHLALGKA